MKPCSGPPATSAVLADDDTFGVDAECDGGERGHRGAGGVRNRDVKRNPF